MATPEKAKEWHRLNPEKVKAKAARWYAKNAERERLKAREKRAANPGGVKESYTLWRARNVIAERQRVKSWSQANPEVCAAYAAARRARIRGATPPWGEAFLIREAYSLARLRSKVTGRRWAVDHIVPLVSGVVCGLHVEQNLRVITDAESARKGNRFWPGMP